MSFSFIGSFDKKPTEKNSVFVKDIIFADLIKALRCAHMLNQDFWFIRSME